MSFKLLEFIANLNNVDPYMKTIFFERRVL